MNTKMKVRAVVFVIFFLLLAAAIVYIMTSTADREIVPYSPEFSIREQNQPAPASTSIPAAADPTPSSLPPMSPPQSLPACLSAAAPSPPACPGSSISMPTGQPSRPPTVVPKLRSSSMPIIILYIIILLRIWPSASEMSPIACMPTKSSQITISPRARSSAATPILFRLPRARPSLSPSQPSGSSAAPTVTVTATR